MPAERARPAWVVAVALWLTVVAPPTAAQTTEQASSLQTAVIRYIQSDLFIRPGIGFKRVSIGHSFDHVARTWGAPQSTNRRFLSFDKQWQYRLDQGAVIVVAGGKRVESITVVGGITTPFETTEGARFGMTRAQIATIYGNAYREQSGSSISYPTRGVSFDFEGGALRAIRVAAPKQG